MYVSWVTLGPRMMTPVTEATSARKSVAVLDVIAMFSRFHLDVETRCNANRNAPCYIETRAIRNSLNLRR